MEAEITAELLPVEYPSSDPYEREKNFQSMKDPAELRTDPLFSQNLSVMNSVCIQKLLTIRHVIRIMTAATGIKTSDLLQILFTE